MRVNVYTKYYNISYKSLVAAFNETFFENNMDHVALKANKRHSEGETFINNKISFLKLRMIR